LIILGITCFIDVFPFALMAFGFAAVMIFLELPILTAWCPTGPRTEKFVKFFHNTLFKTLLYLAFAVLIWISLLMKGTAIVVGAIALSITCVLYGISAMRKDEVQSSFGSSKVKKAAAKAGAAAATGTSAV
ncbi:Golgi apparatus membrane protein tvp18, partial [Blyttiomyces sp. JEL0837]